jgi:hypothetical protein
MTLEFVASYLALCLVAGVAGRNRRIGFWGYFFSSFIFTPFISILFLYFASPRKPNGKNRLPARSNMANRT